MQTDASAQMTLEALRSVPLFASLDDEAARALRDLLSVRTLPAGAHLFRAGDAGDAMYLIEDGGVRIYIVDEDKQEVTLAELARGDFFGEMAIIDGKPRSASAVVSEPARLAVLRRDDFLDFVRRNGEVALEMISAISLRLRRTDELLRRRVSRNVNEMQEEQLTKADRVADLLASFGGSWRFIILLALLLAAWALWQTGMRHDAGIDPFPYQFLGLVLGVIAGIQAPIIMMSQNRQSEKERLRDDMDFQINLKNELAITEILRRLDVLESERLPVLFAEQNERLAAARAQTQAGDGNNTGTNGS
jgi:CRP/FNR family cyclic AMP-dependent transcriptional regulator